MIYASDAIDHAAEEWNRVCGQAVSFKRAPEDSPVDFRLACMEDDGGQGTLASSFFPGLPRRLMSYQTGSPIAPRIHLYPMCFKRPYRQAMYNVLCHELGHVLGLRHEFEENIPSLRIGAVNEHSIMAYPNRNSQWCEHYINDEDRNGLKELYSLKEVKGYHIRDVDPAPIQEPNRSNYIEHGPPQESRVSLRAGLAPGPSAFWARVKEWSHF